VQVPEVIQKALETTPPAFRKSTSNRESMQRKRYWWLPYVVLEFDKNEILKILCFKQFILIVSSDVSRTSNISVSSYLRTAAAVQGQDNMGNDLLMGRVDLTPMLDGHVSRLTNIYYDSHSLVACFRSVV
jgi:serum/glucocorticoid-regulated kinase 2